MKVDPNSTPFKIASNIAEIINTFNSTRNDKNHTFWRTYGPKSKHTTSKYNNK